MMQTKEGLLEMSSHAAEVAGGERFEFGENWSRFLSTLDGALLRSSAHALIPFNPLEPNRVRVQDNQGPARLVFGGTALPATDQPAGRYQATVVVVVNNPGT